jgi:integrase
VSSIETRRNPATGSDSYRVRFRHEGKNRAVTFVSEAKAEAWRNILDTMGAPIALGILEDVETQAPTVAALVEHHIDHLSGVESGTVARYRKILEDHLAPAFGQVPGDRLTRDDVARWVNEARLLNGDAPSPKTLRNWHGLLSDALSSAVKRKVLEVNVAKGVNLPRADAEAGEEMVFLTREEFAVLLDKVRPQWRPLVLTLALTGIRFGEATALTVSALDRASHSARIHTAWKQSGKQGAPKSKKSRRTVAVPDQVFAALEPLTAGKAPHDLVFLSPRGMRVRSGNFYNAAWKPAVDAAEPIIGKRPRVHDLRHTFASWAIQANIPLPVVQRQLGHEHISTTIDTYSHLARSDFDPLLSLGTGITLPDTGRPVAALGA